MADLILGSEMTGIRQVLCVMTLLGYHLIVCYVLSHQEGDLEFCDRTLREQLAVSELLQSTKSTIPLNRVTEYSCYRFIQMEYGSYFLKDV